jgi:hypothetical protein
VHFALPDVTDNHDTQLQALCSPSTGTLFPFGVTTVTCAATDSAGNSRSRSFTVTVQDTTGPVIEEVRLGVGRSDIQNFFLIASESLGAASAMNPRNYIVQLAGRDKRFGTSDDKPVTLRPPHYDSASRTVTLTPKRTIRANQFVQIVAVGVGPDGIADMRNNLLDGNRDGQNGDDYSIIAGRGTSLSYVDRNGDAVSLKLARAGVMELTLAPDQEAQHLQLLDTTLKSRLSGSVHKSKRNGDGRTTIGVVTGPMALAMSLPRCTTATSTDCFEIGMVSAEFIDAVLGERSSAWLASPAL